MQVRPRIKPPPDEYEQLRRRMIAETSAFITLCLRHPELAVRIPVIPAGKGSFPPSLARSFWQRVLFE